MNTREQAATTDVPLLHRVEEAANLLRCGRTTVYALIRSGDLEVVRIGRRTLVAHTSIVAFIDRNLHGSTPVAS